MMMMMMKKEEHLFYNNSLSSRRTFCHPPLPLHLSNSRLDGESTWSSSYSIICLCFLAGHNSTQHRERMKVDGWMDGSFSIRIIYKQLIVAHNRIVRLSTVHCLCHSVCSSSGSADWDVATTWWSGKNDELLMDWMDVVSERFLLKEEEDCSDF